MSSPNKTIVLELYKLLEGPRPFPKSLASPLASPFSPTFTSYHIGFPVFEGTGEQFLGMFESILPLEPKVMFPVKRIIEEGDQVWIWAEVVGWGKTKESIDIFTFKDGKITEKWDVQQEQA